MPQKTEIFVNEEMNNMPFVIIKRNKKNVPSDPDITAAMNESGGIIATITDGGTDGKKVGFTGGVNHTTFTNNLARIAKGGQNSWDMSWDEK